MAEFDLDQEKLPRPLVGAVSQGVRSMLDALCAPPQKRPEPDCEHLMQGPPMQGPQKQGTMTMSYDPDNIFAKILRGDLPAFKVYEDADTFAFMDIMPRADGHLLVIPKTPCRNLLDASPAQIAAVMATVQKLSHTVMAAFDAQGVTVQQFNEAAGGQEVFHLHFHVLPRHDGLKLRPPGTMGDMDVLKGHADKIMAALAG